MDINIAPRKKNPINIQAILSTAIAEENPCPDLIISVRGSKGSNYNFIYSFYYKTNW